MWEKLEAIERRYHELEAEMARPEVARDYDRLQRLAREHASLHDMVSILNDYRRLKDSLDQARTIVEEGGDAELVELASAEIERDEAELQTLEERLRSALVPKDPHDEKDVIVEIRAAAGGEKARRPHPQRQPQPTVNWQPAAGD